jgi:hypothetical protein
MKTRDPSFWKASSSFLKGFTPLRELLRRPRVMPCDTDVSVTLEDMPAMSAYRVEGFRLTLGLGPAVTPSFSADRSAGNKTEIFPHLGLIQLGGFMHGFGAQVSVKDALIEGGFSDAEKMEISDEGRLLAALGGASDPGLDALLDRWIAYLDASDADAIGLSSAHEIDPLTFVLLRRRLLALGGRVPPFIMGGRWLHELSRPFVNELDVLILEEGEAPLLLACHALRHGQDPRWIPGVTVLRPDGGEHLHRVTHSMNVRAVPRLAGFPLGGYTNGCYPAWGEPTIPYQFSLGCPYDCAYCNAWNKRRFKQRDHRLVVHDIERMHEEHGVSHFFFLNEAFNSSPRYADALMEGLVATGREWHWADCAHPTRIDYDMLSRMHRAGCDWLNWGFDTLSDRLSQLYERRVKSAEFAEVLAASTRAGIRNSINVIIGMPHESEADEAELLDFVDRNHQNIHWMFLLPYELVHHSNIGMDPKRYGLRPGEDGGVDEVDGLRWAERQAVGKDSLRRITDLVRERYGNC